MNRRPTNTHFLLETRIIIENRLNEQASITQISKEIKRCKSSIIREIKRHSKPLFPSVFNNVHPCTKYHSCPVKEFDCYLTCKNIEINLCPKLTSSPHVCNGCQTKRNCRHVKIYYKAIEANNEYLFNWKSDRTKLHYTTEELNVINNDFKALFFQTRSIYHCIIIFNKKGYNFNGSTIYRQIRSGRIDIPKQWLLRHHKLSKTQKDKSYKKENIEGHTYEDYLEYKAEHPKANETQMDTVEGIKHNNQSVILTLQIVSIRFLFTFKLEQKKFENVLKKLKFMRTILGEELFDIIFEILLTDNGIEFGNLKEFCEEFPNIHVFYCHPYSSYEKGSIENNHEFLRRIIPKGISLNIYTQNDYNLLTSHINSLFRETLDGACPFDLIDKYIPLDTIKKFGMNRIDEDKVCLNPYLLGEKNILNIKKYLDKKEIKKANIILK